MRVHWTSSNKLFLTFPYSVRIGFMQCVTEVSHARCTKAAAKFLQKMVETLVRSTMRSHKAQQCDSITPKNCSEVSAANPSAMNSWNTLIRMAIFYFFALFTTAHNIMAVALVSFGCVALKLKLMS